MTLFKKERGFTLVELLVVIAIIGVLATLVLLQLGTARAKARDTQRIATVSQISSAVQLYLDDNNGAVPAVASLSTLCTTLAPKYISKCPTTLTNMGYRYNSGTNAYVVWAGLETVAVALGSDADIPSAAVATGGDAAPSWYGIETACTAGTPCFYDQGTQ